MFRSISPHFIPTSNCRTNRARLRKRCTALAPSHSKPDSIMSTKEISTATARIRIVLHAKLFWFVARGTPWKQTKCIAMAHAPNADFALPASGIKKKEGKYELISVRFVLMRLNLYLRQLRTNQRFNLRPHLRITFDVHVFSCENALVPRIAFAGKRSVFIADRPIA